MTKKKMRLKLEVASYNDILAIFFIRNEKEARLNSKNTEKIRLLNHIRWFINMKKKDSELMYMVKLNNKKIGYVRIKVVDCIGEISYCIKREFRNKGYGTEALHLAEDNNDIKQLKAIVKCGNEASEKVFKKLGYKEMNTSMDDYIEFNKYLK